MLVFSHFYLLDTKNLCFNIYNFYINNAYKLPSKQWNLYNDYDIFNSETNIAKNYKTALDIMKFSCISYFLAGIAFKIIYVPLQIYANNEILPLKYLLIGMQKHITQYIDTIYRDMGGGSSVILNIIIGFGIIFIVKSTSEAKINKIFAFILSTITLIFLLIASFGLYIIIVMPIYLPRAFIGFNVLLAILSLYSITYYKKSLKIMSIILILSSPNI